MIQATLVAGADATQREQTIAAELDPALRNAVILEGLPGPGARLQSGTNLEVMRIAAGCPCCEGGLVMRTTLNRLLRSRPDRLYIGLAIVAHLPALRAFLSAPPYSGLLQLTKDLLPGSRSQQ